MLLKNFFVLVLSVDSLEFQYSSSVPQRTFTSLNKNKLPLYDKQETLQTHKPEPLPPVSWHKYIQKPEKHDPRIGSSYWEANVSFSPMCLLSRPKWFKVPSQLDNWHWRAKNTGTKMRHSFSLSARHQTGQPLLSLNDYTSPLQTDKSRKASEILTSLGCRAMNIQRQQLFINTYKSKTKSTCFCTLLEWWWHSAVATMEEEDSGGSEGLLVFIFSALISPRHRSLLSL